MDAFDDVTHLVVVKGAAATATTAATAATGAASAEVKYKVGFRDPF